jgi:hypothetical protein
MRLAVALLLFASVAAPAAQKPKKDEVLISFAGALKTIDHKELVIEPEDGNNIRFVRTKRTRFLDKDGKETGDLSFHLGDVVTIEALQRLTRELEAVNVRPALPKTEQQ